MNSRVLERRGTIREETMLHGKRWKFAIIEYLGLLALVILRSIVPAETRWSIKKSRV